MNNSLRWIIYEIAPLQYVEYGCWKDYTRTDLVNCGTISDEYTIEAQNWIKTIFCTTDSIVHIYSLHSAMSRMS